MNQTPATVPSLLAGTARTVIAAAGGWLVAKGYITAEQAPQIGGLLFFLGALGWSIAHKVSVAKALDIASIAGRSFRP